MSCEPCNPSGDQPPGTTPLTTVALSSFFGGRTVLPRRGCTAPTCPTPPVVDDEGRDPYCPGWLSELLQQSHGKVLIVADDCLYLLNSKCDGYLHYDPITEEVTVQEPRFVDATPRETRFGFLAKVVPTTKNLCIDDNDECPAEIRQELAAQLMETASCGDLVIATAPGCGELPRGEETDAAYQIRLDKLDPGEIGNMCVDGLRIFGWYPSYKTIGGARVPCKRWVSMPRIKMRLSQWEEVGAGTEDETNSIGVRLVPVAGGTTGDKCYELRASRFVPTPAGISFHPLTDRQLLANDVAVSTTTPVALDDFPTAAAAEGDVWAEFEVHVKVGPNAFNNQGIQVHLGSASDATLLARCGFSLALNAGTNSFQSGPFVKRVKVTSGAVSLVSSASPGNNATGTYTAYLTGYHY